MDTCLDIIECFAGMWSDASLQISARVGDIYTYLVKQALPLNSLSPMAQISLSKLLYRLLEVNSEYGNSLGLPSCRSSLLSILQTGSMPVKYRIGLIIPSIFGLFVLKVHDKIFVDILEMLPSDPEKTEGIALRLFALAEMACRWPTLLRRCIYHIFETPGRLDNCAKFASRCLAKVSQALNLGSARELFRLFTPQLLYTWLEHDSIENIPFSIFGFSSLKELAAQAQTEGAALMMMRGQEAGLTAMAQLLGLSAEKVSQQGFSRILAYSIAHDVLPSKDKQQTSESRLRKMLGKEPFADCVYIHFADIVGILFDLIDQEDPIEKAFAKDASLHYAADNMAEIKSFGHSEVKLPPNQQPMFKAKFLTRELVHLCSRTEFELATLWTPALVVSVARRLLNAVHPALGQLHACSVVRKLRVLVCLAGPQATTSYGLEMLLHSIRPFLQDAECADDALGLTRYLITHGEGPSGPVAVLLRRLLSVYAGLSQNVPRFQPGEHDTGEPVQGDNEQGPAVSYLVFPVPGPIRVSRLQVRVAPCRLPVHHPVGRADPSVGERRERHSREHATAGDLAGWRTGRAAPERLGQGASPRHAVQRLSSTQFGA